MMCPMEDHQYPYAGEIEPHPVFRSEPIPETFPSRQAFLRVVGIGIAVTVAQFSILVILIAKPWH
jgi:hypothetical protein